MKHPPLILISPSTDKKGAEFYDYSISLSQPYSNAILAAGGVPLISSCHPDRAWIAEAIRRVDGVMLSGGDDLHPGLYRKRLPAALAKTVGTTDPKRDLLELLILEETFAQKKPLLAICRGHQILNVALGGTLIVDIPQQVKTDLNHARLDKKDRIVHGINVVEGSLLADIFGKTTGQVNSSHHQAVDKLAKGLKVTATAEDGVIEAMEQEGEALLPFLLAVQYHPERLYHRHPEHLVMFRRFVQACAKLMS